MPKFEMYSDARIAFEREIRKHHPEIQIKMIINNSESGLKNDEGINIGVVAAEFNILMDGVYSQGQMEDMYTMLYHKLRDKRKHIITSSDLILPPGVQQQH